MRFRRLRPFASALAALSAFVLISCILGGEKVAGRGSEVENEFGVYGVLVGEDGKPVVGAAVKARPSAQGIGKVAAGARRFGSGMRAGADSDSVVTDAKGKYVFKNLVAGEYDLFGDFKSGSLVVLIPDVTVTNPDSSRNVGIDTLRAPGRIRGRLLLAGKGKGAVLAYVPGTSFLAVSDDSGRFILSGIPQGRYTVGYSATGFRITPDSGVFVLSGITTPLLDKHLAYDPELPPPAPVGLRAEYDTLGEKVCLFWETIPVSDLEGYVVYRDQAPLLEPKVVANGFTVDSSFVDGSFGPVGSGEVWELVYRIKARDTGANLSVSFSSPVHVKAVSRSFATTTIHVRAVGVQGGAVSIGDSLLLIAEYANPGRRNIEVSWGISGGSQPLRARPDTSRAGADTLRWKAGAAGLAQFTASVRDDGGSLWTGTVSVQVLQDPPQAAAGRDTLVSLGDEVRLAGIDSDRFGRIDSRGWKVEGVGTFQTPDGRYAFRAPMVAGRVRCIYWVTDDDGNDGYDTLFVTVLADPPKAQAGADTSVSLGDRVNLHGSGSDVLGQVVRYEWDIGAAGTFAPSRGDTAIFVPKIVGVVPCVLRVTDDDGNQVLDTMGVTVLADAPVASASPDTSVSIGDRVDLRGTGSDLFGSIAKYEWDIGGKGVFVATSRGDTSIQAPASAGSYPCVLRVTDDDGQTALDTVGVAVLWDDPRAGFYTRGLTTGFTSDTVDLSSGNSVDLYGRIVKREIDPGATGNFRTLSGNDTLVVMPAVPTAAYKCILRVTDDDGRIGLDSLTFTILKRGGEEWVKVPGGIGTAARYGQTMQVFQGRLWMIGGSVVNGFETRDVWSSEDGLHWTEAFPAAAFPPRRFHGSAVFAGRLWVMGGMPMAHDLADVWSTEDGVYWTEAIDSAAFGRRREFTTYAAGGKLYITGGCCADTKDYSTADGAVWTAADKATPTYVRAGSAVVMDGKTWIYGMDEILWSTPDPATTAWTRSFTTPIDTAGIPNIAALDHEIWAVGIGINLNQIYRFKEGSPPKLVTSTPPFGRFSGGAITGFKGRIWVMKGGTNELWFTK